MLTDENIEIIENDISLMEGMKSSHDTELIIMKMIRNQLIALGIDKESATIASTQVNIVIDFDPTNEEDIDLIKKYINCIVNYTMKRTMSLVKIINSDNGGDVEENTILTCFIAILSKSKPTII